MVAGVCVSVPCFEGFNYLCYDSVLRFNDASDNLQFFSYLVYISDKRFRRELLSF